MLNNDFANSKNINQVTHTVHLYKNNENQNVCRCEGDLVYLSVHSPRWRFKKTMAIHLQKYSIRNRRSVIHTFAIAQARARVITLRPRASNSNFHLFLQMSPAQLAKRALVVLLLAFSRVYHLDLNLREREREREREETEREREQVRESESRRERERER